MKRNLCIVCLLLCLSVSAQKKGQARIDSLAAALPSITVDTMRLKILNELAVFYTSNNTAEAQRYAEQSVLFAEKVKLIGFTIDAYNTMGNLLKVKGDYPGALQFHQKALTLATNTHDERGIALSLSSMGSCYLYQGFYSKSINAYLDALKIHEKLKSKTGIASVTGNLGNVYVFLKEYDKSTDYKKRALRIYEELDNKNGIAIMTAGIGYNYIYQEQFDKALEYVQRAMKLSEALGNTISVASNSQAIGRVYHMQHKYAEAERYYLKGLEVAEKLGAKINIAQNLVTTAEVYLAVVKDSVPSPFTGELATYRGLLAKGLQYINRAVALRKEINDLNGLNFAYDTKSEIELYSGDAVASLQSYKEHIRYRDSVFNLEKSKEISRRELQYEFGKREDSIRFRQTLIQQDLERQQLLGKQQEQALQLVSKEKELQRLTYLEEQARMQREKELQTSLLEKNKFEAALSKNASDKQIAEQKLQISFDRKVKIYLGVAIALVLFIAFLVYYNQQKTKRLNRIIGKQKAELEELGLVKDRIFSVVSHDMRTPVNTLISFIDILEDDAIPQEKLQLYAAELKNQLTHTSVLMENLLNWSASQMKGFTPIVESLDVKENIDQTIVLLQQQAGYKNIRVINQTATGIAICGDRNMLALVTRNLLSNAIKFTPPNGAVTIDAARNGDLFEISISDSGTGMPAAKLALFNDAQYLHAIDTKKGTQGETGTGLGLMLCKTFAALMKGAMRAESREGAGSTFTIILPAA